MTAARCNGSFEKVPPPADAATVDPLDFGGRLELGGGGESLEEIKSQIALSATLYEALRADVHAASAQLTMLKGRYAGIARRIEAEVVEALSRMQPDSDPRIGASLRIILSLASLIEQAGIAAAGAGAAAEEGRP